MLYKVSAVFYHNQFRSLEKASYSEPIPGEELLDTNKMPDEDQSYRPTTENARLQTYTTTQNI